MTKLAKTNNPMNIPNSLIGTIGDIAFENKATMVVKDVAAIAVTLCSKAQDILYTSFGFRDRFLRD